MIIPTLLNINVVNCRQWSLARSANGFNGRRRPDDFRSIFYCADAFLSLSFGRLIRSQAPPPSLSQSAQCWPKTVCRCRCQSKSNAGMHFTDKNSFNRTHQFILFIDDDNRWRTLCIFPFSLPSPLSVTWDAALGGRFSIFLFCDILVVIGSSVIFARCIRGDHVDTVYWHLNGEI